MEKKQYMAPTRKIVDADAALMLCASTTDIGVSNKPKPGTNADLANKRRGDWGSLWN